MISLSCPKCRQALADDALDAGACPLCGFPLDGPVLLSAPSRSRTWVLLLGVVSLLALAGVGYAIFTPDAPSEPNRQQPTAEVAVAPQPSVEAPALPVRQVAPPPREVKPAPADSGDTNGQPVAPVEPKREGPRPVGVAMPVNPKVAPKRHFDHPDDTATVCDLRTGDHVVLTGRVRILKLGSVSGKAVLDASGLVAEEVFIGGDLSGESQVLVCAPNGPVAVNGFVSGAAKLTIAAPGGSVTFAGALRVSSGAQVTATAKSFEVKCPMSDGARATVTLTAGGVLKIARMEDGAVVSYRKANANDPPPIVEKGLIRDRAQVVEAK